VRPPRRRDPLLREGRGDVPAGAIGVETRAPIALPRAVAQPHAAAAFVLRRQPFESRGGFGFARRPLRLHVAQFLKQCAEVFGADAIAGHQRGRSTAERIRRNFGKPYPEGYRKAARVFDLASRFGLPVITFIDTQGAEPGVGAEERGQSEAIAANLELMAKIEAPVIACVIGEGGSGGALALGVGNAVLMQEYACYSVITPEGCAAILWREGGPQKIAEAARALRLSAEDLLHLGVIDEIVPEPPGGAHREPAEAIVALGRAIERQLKRLMRMTPAALREDRARKFAAMGTAYITRTRVENGAGIG